MAKHRSGRLFLYAAFISSLFLIAYALFHLSQRAKVTQSKSRVILSQTMGSVSHLSAEPDRSDRVAETQPSSGDSDTRQFEHGQIKSSLVDSDSDFPSPDAQLATSNSSSGLHSQSHLHLHIDSESSTLPPAFKDEEHHHGEYSRLFVIPLFQSNRTQSSTSDSVYEVQFWPIFFNFRVLGLRLPNPTINPGILTKVHWRGFPRIFVSDSCCGYSK
jgi:hypothetical protein